MTLIAIGGDAATTTTLALAAGWPNLLAREPDHLADDSAHPAGDRAGDTADNDLTGSDVVVIEADASGGSLAAWLDTPLSPSLSALVTSLHQSSGSGSTPAAMWKTIDSMIRRSGSGIRFVPAPFKSREARGAINEADHTLFPLLAASEQMVGLVDVGRIDPLRIPSTTRHADLVIVAHRQETASAPAATVRLERLAETVDALRTTGHEVALAIIGNEPFPLEEVVVFAAPGARAWTLAVDDLAAQVFAGRSGVSAKRLARLPLPRSATRAAADLAFTTGRAMPGAASSVPAPAPPREVAR
jgi:hypothetical protein